MKSHSARRKITSPIPASRWLTYTTAGAATALGLASSAEAAITVVNVNETFDAGPGSTSVHYFQLSGANSFGMLQQKSYYGYLGSAKFGIFGGGAFKGFSSAGFPYVSKLAFGANIAGAGFAVANVGTLAFGYGYANSQWLTAGQGYIGFKFTDAGGQEYGWASVTANGVAAANTFTLNSYAYTTAGEVIKAGQTSLAVPEPGSLALLAAGGAGLLAWRQRRAKSAAQA